jgi:hypothetical protein
MGRKKDGKLYAIKMIKRQPVEDFPTWDLMDGEPIFILHAPDTLTNQDLEQAYDLFCDGLGTQEQREWIIDQHWPKPPKQKAEACG